MSIGFSKKYRRQIWKRKLDFYRKVCFISSLCNNYCENQFVKQGGEHGHEVCSFSQRTFYIAAAKESMAVFVSENEIPCASKNIWNLSGKHNEVGIVFNMWTTMWKRRKKCDNWIGNTYNSSREMTTITGDWQNKRISYGW